MNDPTTTPAGRPARLDEVATEADADAVRLLHYYGWRLVHVQDLAAIIAALKAHHPTGAPELVARLEEGLRAGKRPDGESVWKALT